MGDRHGHSMTTCFLEQELKWLPDCSAESSPSLRGLGHMPKIKGQAGLWTPAHSHGFHSAQKELKERNLKVTKSTVKEHCKKFQLYQGKDLNSLSQTDEDQIGD